MGERLRHQDAWRIRIPASYCGLLGVKTTDGRVPRGHFHGSSLTSCFGPMARSIGDAARYFDCVTGPVKIDVERISPLHAINSFERAAPRPRIASAYAS